MEGARGSVLETSSKGPKKMKRSWEGMYGMIGGGEGAVNVYRGEVNDK